MYLLDTNVVSELRRPRPHGAVLDWIADVPAEQLFVPAVTVGEIQAGIEITREQDAAKAEELEAWLNKVLASYGVLPMDASAFREWARLMHRRSDTMTEDAMIAATATVHRLTVVTRNVSDFVRLGVGLRNPFDRESSSLSIVKGALMTLPRQDYELIIGLLRCNLGWVPSPSALHLPLGCQSVGTCVLGLRH